MRRLHVVNSSFFANSHPFPETLLLRPALCLNTLQTLSFLLSLCFSVPPHWSLVPPNTSSSISKVRPLTSPFLSPSTVCIMCRTEMHLKYQFLRRYFACMVFFSSQKNKTKHRVFFATLQLLFSGNSSAQQLLWRSTRATVNNATFEISTSIVFEFAKQFNTTD